MEMKRMFVILFVSLGILSLALWSCSDNPVRTGSVLDEYSPFEDVTFTPAGLFVGETTAIMIRARMDADSTYSSIVLISGTDTVASLYDDGSMSHGDDIVGDNVYSCRFDLAQDEEVDFQFELTANIYDSLSDSEAEYKDSLRCIPCFVQPSEGAIVNMLAVQDTAAAIFFRVDSSQGESVAIESVSVYLTGHPAVDNFTPVTNAIIINYEIGIKGGIYYPEEGMKGGSKRASSPSIPLNHQTRGISPYYRCSYVSSIVEDDDFVESNDALIYSPWRDSFGPGESEAVRTRLESSECPSFTTALLINGECTVDALSNLTSFGVIYLDTHGMEDDGNQICFMTREESDLTSIDLHSLDLLSGNIMHLNTTSGDYFWIRPGYITALFGNFPNSIFYNSSCESYKNSTMRNAVINKGAGVYLGYTENVGVTFATNNAIDFFDGVLISSNTVSDGFTPGRVEPPAEWLMSPISSDLAFDSDIINPSFETYSGSGVPGWHGEGDARIISSLVDQTPTDGSRMAIISTGLGYTTDAGSIEQSFCFPSDATQLSIDWNMISEEWLEYVGSEFQDYIRITLETTSGTVTLLNLAIDDLEHDVYSTTTIYFDQGDCYLTGWRTSTFDISAYAGQSVTLKIATHDIGDSIYDSAVLIDKIIISTSSPTT